MILSNVLSQFFIVKIGVRAKIKKRGWGRKDKLADKPLDFENLRSPANGAREWLTCVNHRIKRSKLVYKNFSPNKVLVVSFDSTVGFL